VAEGARRRSAGPGLRESGPLLRAPYVGNKGWIGVHLDGPEVDWAELTDLVADSYRLIAPKRLAKKLDTD